MQLFSVQIESEFFPVGQNEWTLSRSGGHFARLAQEVPVGQNPCWHQIKSPKPLIPM